MKKVGFEIDAERERERDSMKDFLCATYVYPLLNPLELYVWYMSQCIIRLIDFLFIKLNSNFQINH